VHGWGALMNHGCRTHAHFSIGLRFAAVGDVIRPRHATSLEDLTERCWARVLTDRWPPKRRRAVRRELKNQLLAYWEHRLGFEPRPVPGRPGDWGLFFRRGISQPLLEPTGLRPGHRFTPLEGHSVALVGPGPTRPIGTPVTGREPRNVPRPPGRPRNVHGWGALMNHGCPTHAHFYPTGGWTGRPWTWARPGEPGSEAFVFYSEAEDVQCTLHSLGRPRRRGGLSNLASHGHRYRPGIVALREIRKYHSWLNSRQEKGTASSTDDSAAQSAPSADSNKKTRHTRTFCEECGWTLCMECATRTRGNTHVDRTEDGEHCPGDPKPGANPP